MALPSLVSEQKGVGLGKAEKDEHPFSINSLLVNDKRKFIEVFSG